VTAPSATTRRAFLRRASVVGGALAVGLPLARCGGADGARRRGRVVVVGAGLAGLAAATELARAGFAVTVLEARMRVGGRVHTVRFPGGQHAEAGGEFVDTSHTVLRSYARTLRLPLEDVRRQGADLPGVAYLGGRRTIQDSLYTPRVDAEIARYQARLDTLAAPLSTADPLRRGAALDRRSAASLLDELALDPAARLLIEHDLRDEYTVEPDRLSLLFLAHLAKLTADLPDSGVEAFRIRGGNARLPRALAVGLSADVRVGTIVDAISADPRGVRVQAGRRTFRGDWCVLTIPVPALRAVRVSPALPAAVGELQYGTAVKTMLQYDPRVWRNQGFNGDTLTDLTLHTTWEATDGQPGRAGVLLAYTGAANGARLGARAPAARIAEVAGELETIYPGSRAALRTGITQSWQGERFTGGTYTAPAPGQMTRCWAALRRPYGRLVLAGEHTDAYASYMEGALRSGRRAAAYIHARD
jgi:monoamine oxidase